MAVVDLTGLKINRAIPMPVTFGGVQRPATGGEITRIRRMGSRWAFTFSTPMMPLEPDHRTWSAKFDRAENDGAAMEVYLPDFAVGNPGNPVVRTATAAGLTVPLSGLTPGYVVRAGQWMSLIVSGRRYLDRIQQDAVVSQTGIVDVAIKNLLRRSLTVGVVAELAVPKIEGSLEYASPPEWTVDRMSMFAFTITEDA